MPLPPKLLPILLFTALSIKQSQQSCSSTPAVTTCTWDTLRSSRPVQVPDYKTYFAISKGNLDRVPDGAFKHLPHIVTLQLSNNKITRLDRNALEGLVDLKQLNLYDNQLTTVDGEVFAPVRGLERLDLGMNRIEALDERAFEHLESLKHLNIAFNSLKTVPVGLKSLHQLQTLRLDNNGIVALKSQTFSSLVKLEDLSLNDNKISAVEEHPFKGLKKLKKLDLRSNFLRDLDAAELVGDMPSLKKVSLSLNDFRCDILSRIVDSLKKSGVEVTKGVSKSPNQVHGITCKH